MYCHIKNVDTKNWRITKDYKYHPCWQSYKGHNSFTSTVSYSSVSINDINLNFLHMCPICISLSLSKYSKEKGTENNVWFFFQMWQTQRYHITASQHIILVLRFFVSMCQQQHILIQYIANRTVSSQWNKGNGNKKLLCFLFLLTVIWFRQS